MRNEVLYSGMGMRTLGRIMCTKEGKQSGLKTIPRTPKDHFKHWRRWKMERAKAWTCLQCA